MTSFLGKTAKHLFERYGSDLSEICIVMPNRRAGLFLNRFLAAELSRPVWAPAMFSVEDFLAKIARMKEVEPIHLLIELYDIHKETDGEKAQLFEEFLSWGPQLLTDFNDIDRYLADAGELFGYLDEVRAINLWNLDKTPLTEFQKNYLAFYHSLGSYYTKLVQRLLSRGEGYQGLVFREASRRIADGTGKVPWSKVVFIGFNALTKAEEQVMTHLHRDGQAEFIWDADRYYLEQSHQEAGSFLRQWLSVWPEKEKRWVSEDFLNGAKEIEVVGVPNVTGQVKFCGELLQLRQLPAGENTAIVLPDESLLMPLLNSLPAEVDELNITMGLPLKHTPLADLLENVLQMHLHAAGMEGSRNSGKRFYFRDVLKILQHPLVTGICRRILGNQFALSEVTARVRSGNQVFLSKDDLHGSDLFSAELGMLDPFFEPWPGPSEAIPFLRRIVEMVRESIQLPDRSADQKPESLSGEVDTENAFVFARLLLQLSEIVNRYPSYFTLKTFCNFFRQLTQSTTLPFYGEPLKGTQIMGMLETRTLDFDNLIILSCNEGLLPSGKTAHSFIPFDIKREFGLPTYHHKDAVYAYHFFRLLQRAKKVWLLYNTEPNLLKGGEKSRFIQQICRELPLYNPAIKIHEQLLVSVLQKNEPYPPIIIAKEGEVLETMVKKARDGFAPTALNAFRNCALRFYFSAIAGLKEPEEAADTIDPKTLGVAVHKALQVLYTLHQHEPLTTAAITTMIAKSDEAVQQAFAEKFKGSSTAFGKNLLLVNVARFMVRNFLNGEMDLVKELSEKGAVMKVELLEQHLRRPIHVCAGEVDFEVIVKGVVDRVDRMGDETRVIDYKTGLSDKTELQVNGWEDLQHDPLLDKGFQLLTYAWLLHEKASKSVMRAGIISLKSLGSGFMTVNVPAPLSGNQDAVQPGTPKAKQPKTDKLGEEEMVAFEAQLKLILEALFDTAVPFLQTESRDVCARCPYISICGR